MTEKQTPEISVGIVSGSGLTFTLNGGFTAGDSGRTLSGRFTALAREGNLLLKSESETVEAGSEVNLTPKEFDNCSFTLHAVTIGVDFHWQRNEDQTFRGTLRFIIRGGQVTAVNLLPVEDYLFSVISSEMSATSSGSLLRAHAVISRSWLLAQIDKTLHLSTTAEKYRTSFVSGTEITRWYDREDHKEFDVCADDHCQRYQGITRASTREVEQAVRDTRGEVLMSGDAICDARYSKCCGGITELFENVWEPVSHPYLRNLSDGLRPPEGFDTDLSIEENAVSWIMGNPDAFCNTADANILSQVLNNYDRETNDFFRWKVVYSQGELSTLVRERTGIDFGLITALEPLSRGTSGRIIRLKITGENKTMIIGKELEIRKALSKSHLYSSAFVVETVAGEGEMTFILRGAGWGHGVGLCQIGAAVMGASGFGYREILSHYFVKTDIIKMY
ncbi:MAG: SpoIID/LytB domain-containing protein [Bacteroidales bacterium]|nr:SpoIID/LytB domain-containing protein [Bacteroidales bacterium]